MDLPGIPRRVSDDLVDQSVQVGDVVDSLGTVSPQHRPAFQLRCQPSGKTTTARPSWASVSNAPSGAMISAF